MNCDDSQNLMPLFLSGERDWQGLVDFERHIETCAACQTEINLQKNYDNLLREAFAEETQETAALRERVRRQIRAAEKPRASWWKIPQMRFGFAAAALLIVFCAGIFYFFSKHNQPTIYAGIARDHTEDVIEQTPKIGWHDGESQAINYADEQLGDATIVSAITPEGFRLVKTRLCNPAGEPFVHLIFDNGTRQISFYVRKRGASLSGEPFEISDNRAFFAERIKDIEISAFQTDRLTVIIAAQLPRSEILNLARDTAQRIG